MTNINQRNRKIKQRFLNNLSNISSYIESQLLHLAGYIVIIERNIGTPVLPEQVIGNQVRILSDPVTVSAREDRRSHCTESVWEGVVTGHSASQETCWRVGEQLPKKAEIHKTNILLLLIMRGCFICANKVYSSSQGSRLSILGKSYIQ